MRLDDGWRVDFIATLERGCVLAPFLIDAAGRAGCIPGGRMRYAPPTVAICTAVDDAGQVTAGIEAVPEGWFWFASVNPERVSVMFFCNSNQLHRYRTEGLLRCLRMQLASTKLLSRYAGRRFLYEPLVYDASCWYSNVPIAQNCVKVGEASYTVDPLSSSGMEKALQNAIEGAAIAHTLAKHPSRLLSCATFCQRRQQEAVAVHTRWAAEYYSKVDRFADAPFWMARRTVATNSADAPVPKRPPRPSAGTRVGLAPGVSFISEPCLVNGEIDTRPAVIAPSFRRAFVFLDGIEAACLLGETASYPTWEQLLRRWSQTLPAPKVQQLEEWLWDNCVLSECASEKPQHV